MEAGINLLSSSSSPFLSSRTHLRSFLPTSSTSSTSLYSSSSSVLKLQAAPGVFISMPTIPTSVLSEEQGDDEYRPQLRIFKQDKASSQATLERREIESTEYDELVADLKRQLVPRPDLWSSWHSSQVEEESKSSSPIDLESFFSGNQKNIMEVGLDNAVALATEALEASKQAASLAEEPELMAVDDFDYSLSRDLLIPEKRTVKSTRLQERRSKRRRMPKEMIVKEHYSSSSSTRREDLQRKLSEEIDLNDPLRLFLWGPETKQLLTHEEESNLIVKIQDVMKLEEVKVRLQSQFGQEPNVVEWAKAVGVNCRDLKARLHLGQTSRDKLIYANLRMVVHIAKQYQNRGLSLHDLLQEGSMGLMRSVEKFKPQAGCRFATYAYWWIRQTIRKAIFQHSRTIRLPENVYTLLGKVREAKGSHIQEGNHNPTKEEIAESVTITVEKLEKILFMSRMPLSMQQPVWADQDTTFQEITADNGVEVPDSCVAKDLMRRHVRGLLSVLSPKERRIIRLRFGIDDGKEKTLLEIGNMFGLSKERVRQLEGRALYKLKKYTSSHGLEAYADLLV